MKHGPNYEEQIEGLHETIGALAKTQEDFRQQHLRATEDEKERLAAEEKKAEAARWEPTATIERKVEGQQYMNKLILKSPQSFRLLEVSLLSSKGAKLLDYPMKDSWLSSTSFGFEIPHGSLNTVAEISPTFFQDETFDGALRFKVQLDGKDPITYVGEIPFHGGREYVQRVCSFRLRG